MSQISRLNVQVRMLTGNAPLANGSSLDTEITRSEIRGGTGFVGGIMTSS